MSRVWAVMVAAVTLVGCAGPAPGTVCDEHTPCAEPFLCDVTEHLCRLRDAPQIKVSAPTRNTVLTGTSTTVTGTLELRESLRHPTLSELALGDGGEQDAAVSNLESPYGFQLTVPLPPTDDQEQVLTLTSKIPGSDAGILEWPLRIDNVAPTATLLPGTPPGRGADLSFAIRFSEEVTSDDPVPVLLTPDAGAPQWLSGHSILSFPQLAYDTPYTVTLAPGAVRDLAGNPNDAGFSLAFLTRVHPPARLETDAGLGYGTTPILQFDSASDEDGVLTIAVEIGTAPRTLAGFTFDPKTGDQVPLGGTALAEGLRNLRAVAWSRQQDGGTVLRTAGFVYDRLDPGNSQVTQQAAWRVGEGPVQSASALGLIPVPPAACETGAAADSVALITPTPEYTRAGLGPAGWTNNPDAVSFADGEAWETVEITGGDLLRQGRQGCSTFGPRSLLSLHDALDSPATLSTAATLTGQRLFLYDGSFLGRTEVCCTVLDGGACDAPVVRAIGAGGWVQSELRGGWVAGAQLDAGTIELLERDTTDCQSPWTVIGGTPSAGVRQFRPVRDGPRTSLLVLGFTDGLLRIAPP